MRRVAREIAHALGADMVGAYLADPAQQNLWPVAGYHVPPAMLDSFRRFPIPIKNHRAIEEAWTHRRAVWTDDMGADRRVDPGSYQQFPHQSDLFVPICIKDRPVGGFFTIWWSERRSFTEEQVRLLQGISDLAGIFLENAQLYREAAEANRAKDEFLATLSHELRNPLGAIANAVAALDRRGAQEATGARLRQIIRRQTHHLTRLVDDLLDVARATAGKIALNRQPLDLSEVAGACVRSLRDSGRGREQRLTFRAESVIVSADATRLAQVVTNMLENAIKFTPPSGSVDIDVLREGQDAVLRVTDTGVGIPAEMLSRVFELFAQAEQPMDRSAGGLGIGLTLSRRLVEMHGGTIVASSEGAGRGAQFTVRLPVEAGRAPLPQPLAPGGHESRRILIVEDNDDARESLRLLLESLGHEVIEASEGRLGVALALEEHPDVVLIDLGLPGLDGYEVAQALRSSPIGKTAALIAVTGYGQADDRRRSKEAARVADPAVQPHRRLASPAARAPAATARGPFPERESALLRGLRVPGTHALDRRGRHSPCGSRDHSRDNHVLVRVELSEDTLIDSCHVDGESRRTIWCQEHRLATDPHHAPLVSPDVLLLCTRRCERADHEQPTEDAGHRKASSRSEHGLSCGGSDQTECTVTPPRS